MGIGGGGPRVAFFGNVANSHYRCVTAVRELGLDAHLFISRTDPPGCRPENESPEIAGRYPEWIHSGNWITPSSLLMPWRAPITIELAEFDAVVASGPGPIFAQFAGVPWAFYVTGGDLTVKPFPFTFWNWYPNLPHRLAEVLAGAWQRRGARRANRVWMQRFAPTVDAADRIGIPESVRSEQSFPFVIDTSPFVGGKRTAADRWVAEAIGSAEFVVFHPSRLVMEPTCQLVRTGQWKGNDVLFRGFARFIKDSGVDAKLVLPDRVHSRDVEQARAMLATLGVSDHALWLSPPDGVSFDQEHMRALYHRSDVVVDELGVGWFGYVTLEGLASSRPVICHVDEEVMAQMYPNHPILDADGDWHVAERLKRLSDDTRFRRELGTAGRRWVEEHHSAEAAARTYVDAIEGLLSR